MDHWPLASILYIQHVCINEALESEDDSTMWNKYVTLFSHYNDLDNENKLFLKRKRPKTLTLKFSKVMTFVE